MNKKKKLLFLLRKNAVGSLPLGFTALDCIESSGTQKIELSRIIDAYTGIRGKWQQTALYGGLSAGVEGTQPAKTRFCPVYFSGSYSTGVFGYGSFFFGAPYQKDYMEPVEVMLNWLNDKRSVFRFEGTTVEGENLARWEILSNDKIALCAGIYRHFGLQLSQGEDIIFDFVPVINTAGEPGLWDNVSKRFFGNTGTGTFGYKIKNATTAVKVRTFSPRDPYYVAPSGVYARLVAEDSLEILADTEETTGTGWEWFANTAEAYEHFGIVPGDSEQPPD